MFQLTLGRPNNPRANVQTTIASSYAGKGEEQDRIRVGETGSR